MQSTNGNFEWEGTWGEKRQRCFCEKGKVQKSIKKRSPLVIVHQWVLINARKSQKRGLNYWNNKTMRKREEEWVESRKAEW